MGNVALSERELDNRVDDKHKDCIQSLSAGLWTKENGEVETLQATSGTMVTKVLIDVSTAIILIRSYSRSPF